MAIEEAARALSTIFPLFEIEITTLVTPNVGETDPA